MAGLVLLLAGTAAGFSLDPDTATVYRGEPHSWFGFSVAAHRDHDTGW